MKIFKKLFSIGIASCLVLSIMLFNSSCDTADPDAILLTKTYMTGTWYEDNEVSNTLTFNADGTMLIGTLSGVYTIENGNVIVETLTGSTAKRHTVTQKDGNKLWITNPSGVVYTLTKL